MEVGGGVVDVGGGDFYSCSSLFSVMTGGGE
jgi:hypothetical protein